MTVANIQRDIEIMQAWIKADNVQYRRTNATLPSDCEWHKKTSDEFNFVDYEYRIAPDVVYKIELGDLVAYEPNSDAMSRQAGTRVTKGYWVEGEL